MPFQPQIRIETKMPRMNIKPPIVGVPAFPACQVGPSSRMLCPALSFLSSGTRNFPVIAETAKLSMQAMMIFMFVFLRRVGGVLPLYLREPLAHDLPLVEVVFYRSDLLIGLVPLAAEDATSLSFASWSAKPMASRRFSMTANGVLLSKSAGSTSRRMA